MVVLCHTWEEVVMILFQLSAWPMVTSLTKRSQTRNAYVCFVRTKFYLLSESVSSSQPKIETERRSLCLQGRDWQWTGWETKERRQTTFVIFLLTGSFMHAWLFCASSPHQPSCLMLLFEFVLISSSSCCAASTDFPDSLSPFISIIPRFWQVFKTTSCIHTVMLSIGSSWSSNTCISVWRGP